MDPDEILKEATFKAMASGGPGGQHANKAATKVQLYFDIRGSEALGQREKNRLLRKLGNQLNKDGVLILHSSESRSQHHNRERVSARLLELLAGALKKEKKRKKTKPTKASRERRLARKKIKSEKKKLRKKPPRPPG